MQITLNKSGVVLRGKPGTVLLAVPPKGCCNNAARPDCKDVVANNLTCFRRTAMIKIGSDKKRPGPGNSSTQLRIKQPYVPSGAQEFILDAPDEESLERLVGNAVMVVKLPTSAWGKVMRFAPPPGQPRPKQCNNRSNPGVWAFKCTSAPPGSQPASCSQSQWFRRITKVDPLARRVVLDAPVSDSINASLAYGWVITLEGGFDVQHVGVEGVVGNFKLARCHQLSTHASAKQYYKDCYAVNTFITTTENVEHGWVRDVTSIDASSGVSLLGRFLTVMRAKALSTADMWDRGAKPGVFDLGNSASQALLDSLYCNITNAFCLTTGRTVGPNVVRNSWVASPVEPHMRWATGLLMEGVGGVRPQLMNRCCMGGRSGHGWTVGYSVVWQGNYSGKLVLAKAPIGTNWVLGTNGKDVISNDSKDFACVDKGVGEVQNVAPFASLYDAQLRERLGGSATDTVSPGKQPPWPASR